MGSVTGVTRGWVDTLSELELFILNTLNRNKDHLNCRLIIKDSYGGIDRHNALYCADHDCFLTWIKQDSYEPQHTLEKYEFMGINTVTYPKDNTFERMLEESMLGSKKLKMVSVVNFKTGKKTKIWLGYKGNPFRDPSMPEYWDFIKSFL
jgi:hypothetical protein